MTSPQVATQGKTRRLPVLAGTLLLVVALLLSAAPAVGVGRPSAAMGRLTADAGFWSNAGALPSARHMLAGSRAEPQWFSSALQAATPLAVGTPVACAGGENLLPNGDFEAGTEGWYVNENVESVTADTHEGALAARLGAGDDDAYMDHGVSIVDPGATYTLSGWGKLTASGEVGEFGVQFYDSEGERLLSEEPAPHQFTGTDFEQGQLTFSLPVQAAKVYVFLSKVEGAADFYADSLSLTVCEAMATEDVSAVATPLATPGIEMLTTPTVEAAVATPTEEPVVATPTAELGATPEATQASDATVAATEPAAERSACDPAYPEDRTCIPPGPPFDQGCAITTERNFVVLPPDPQNLDRDRDGIGCEPIS